VLDTFGDDDERAARHPGAAEEGDDPRNSYRQADSYEIGSTPATCHSIRASSAPAPPRSICFRPTASRTARA
jgi:hypothetical protein